MNTAIVSGVPSPHGPKGCTSGQMPLWWIDDTGPTGEAELCCFLNEVVNSRRILKLPKLLFLISLGRKYIYLSKKGILKCHFEVRSIYLGLSESQYKEGFNAIFPHHIDWIHLQTIHPVCRDRCLWISVGSINNHDWCLTIPKMGPSWTLISLFVIIYICWLSALNENMY